MSVPSPRKRVEVELRLSSSPNGGSVPSGDVERILLGVIGRHPRIRIKKRTVSLVIGARALATLVRAAESAELDHRLAQANGGFVQEILADGACAYSHIPAPPAEAQRPIKSVPSAIITRHLPEIDVLLVTTTPIERSALHNALRPLPGESALLEGPLGKVTCWLGQLVRYCVAHVECAMGSVGRSASVLTVSEAVGAVAPKIVLVVGIAFGNDRVKQRLGDVIVAETVIPYEPGRAGRTVQARGQPLNCGIKLSNLFRSRRADWHERRGDDRVAVFQGPLLSGEKVVDSLRFRETLSKAFPRALGGEMEGAGAYAAAEQAGVEILLVKSICDWADGTKSDRAQPFAAHTAVSLVRHILTKPDALASLGARDSGLPREQSIGTVHTNGRSRLLRGIDLLPQDWAPLIGAFLDAYRATREGVAVFCGREDDVAGVHAWLERVDAPPNLIVTAPAGRGKSALLVRLALSLAERENVEVAFVPVSRRFETDRPDVFLGCLVARLAALHGRSPPDLSRTSVPMLQRMLSDDLGKALPEGRTLVVILDGLDERAGWTLRPGLLPAQHPRSVRVIVSARDQTADPTGERWLGELGWRRGSEAEIVKLPRLGEVDIMKVLQQLDEPHRSWSRLPAVVSRLTDLCKGEPLTIWFLLDALVKLSDPAELSVWEPGLSAAFELWWEEQRRRWGEETPLREPGVRAILHLLAAADGGLTRADLLALLSEEIPDGTMLDEELKRLSWLVLGDGKKHPYVLQHPGFGQHLGEQNDLEPWRRRLSAYGRMMMNELAAGRRAVRDVPRYVVERRASQLVRERAPIADWMMLVTRSWCDAWEVQDHAPSGFLDGVTQSWTAVAVCHESGGDHLPEEARCALVQGSVGSVVGNVDARLLDQILEHQIWTPEQAFAYIRTAPVGTPGSGGRHNVVHALVRRVPSSLLPALFEVACELERKPGSSHDTTIEELMVRMASEAPEAALVTLRKLEPTWRKPARFLDFAAHRPEALRAEVLGEARDLIVQQDLASERARLLVRLAGLLPESERASVLREALHTAKGAPEQQAYWCCRVFADLARTLPEASAEALRWIPLLHEHERARTLVELIPVLPEAGRPQAIALLREEIRSARRPTDKARYWRALASAVPEELDVIMRAALTDIAGIGDSTERADALRVVFGYTDQTTVPDLHSLDRDLTEPSDGLQGRLAASAAWTRELAPQVLSVLKTIECIVPRIHVLEELTRLLTPEQIWSAVQDIWQGIEELLRGPAVNDYLDSLRLPFVVAPTEIALGAARGITGPSQRADLLLVVAWGLPPPERAQVLQEVLEDALLVKTPRRRADILSRLFDAVEQSAQEDVFASLVRAIEETADPYERSCKWLRLVPRFLEPWKSHMIAIAAADAVAIEPDHARFDHLCRLVKLAGGGLRASLFSRALAMAQPSPGAKWSSKRLSVLADLVPPKKRSLLVRQALDATRQIDDGESRLDAMLAYATSLPQLEVDALAKRIDEIQSSTTRANKYLRLLRDCPEHRDRYLDRALEAARSAVGRWLHDATPAVLLAQVLLLAPPASHRLLASEALDAVKKDLESVERLPEVAYSEDPRRTIYDGESGTSADSQAASALALLAPYLTDEEVGEALDVAATIDEITHRSFAMGSLAFRLGVDERARIAEAFLIAKLPHRGTPDTPQARAQLATAVAPLLPVDRRVEVEAVYVAPLGEPPLLWADLPIDLLLERVDHWLALKKSPHKQPGRTLARLVHSLPPEPRARVLQHLLDHLDKLDVGQRMILLAWLLPHLPPSWVESYFERTQTASPGDLSGLAAATAHLSLRQLDRALDLAAADRSAGSPTDARLEALAAIGAARLRLHDPPRDRLRTIVHETLLARSETRAGALLVLTALRPLIVGLGGMEAAVGVVRAIREVGEEWP